MQARFKFRYYDIDNRMQYFPLTDCYYTNLDYSRLMQSTGLKDKNGKLIYEGDIVKALNYINDVRYLCSFVPIFGGLGLISKRDLKNYNFCKENWKDYLINGEVRRLDNRFKLANQGNKLNCFSMGSLIMNDYEIIGNIHENPELLENAECQ